MSDEKTGGSVFPTSPIYNGDDEVVKAGPGMTLRDYFAAQAIPFAAERAAKGVPDYELRQHFGGRGGITNVEIIAALSYSLADAMLAERST